MLQIDLGTTDRLPQCLDARARGLGRCQLSIKFRCGEPTSIVGNVVTTWKSSGLCYPAVDTTYSSRGPDGVPWEDWSIELVDDL